MNVLKLLYPSSSLKGKVIRIKQDVKTIIKPKCKEKFWVQYYGAYKIDPKYLIFWICVKSDKVKNELRSDIELINKLKSLFTKYKYPKKALNHVEIDFESQETVDRESDGDWYIHFK